MSEQTENTDDVDAAKSSSSQLRSPEEVVHDMASRSEDVGKDRLSEQDQRGSDQAEIAKIRASLSESIINGKSIQKPFADSLKPTDFDVGNVIIWQQEDAPRILIRESKIGENETLDSLEASIREGEALFANLRDMYGIKVVSMNSKREKNKDGEETIFTLVDRIEGQNLSKVETLPTETRDELEALYLSLGQHYYDAWKQGLKYWGDCRSDQFVYGNKYGESDKHFFVVDVDPKFYREGDDKFATIEAALGSVCGELLESERKFHPKVRFHAARDALLRIINEILESEPGLNMIIEAKTWLQDAGV